MGAGSTMTNCNYAIYTSSISHSPPASVNPKTLFKGRNNVSFNFIQCKQYNTQLKTIAPYDMFHCERTTMIRELRDSSRKRKRNRNFRTHFNMKPLDDLTNEDNPLQSSGKELLNTNDHTTGGLGGGLVHNSDVGKEINVVNGDDEFSMSSERTPLHKDTCDTRFIIRHNIIQSSPNLKSVYDLFLSAQITPKKKQMSCQLKKRPTILNIHKYCSVYLNSHKDNNDALALNISIDHVPQYQHNNNNNNGDSSNSNSNNIVVHQHNNNNTNNTQHHQSHTTAVQTQTQTQFSSNYHSSILFNYNNNTINSSINNISSTTLSSNLKSIQHELSAQITAVYRLAKTRDSISSLDELSTIEVHQSKLYSTFKELAQASTHIIYSSYLNKMLSQMNSKFPSSSSQVKYSPKYCIVTKHEFAYYASKEKVIMLGKPVISIPLKHITKVITLHTNSKIHLLLFFKSNSPSLKQSSFENQYKRGEGYFLLSGSERGLSGNADIKNTLMDKEICKWFLILNYLLLTTK